MSFKAVRINPNAPPFPITVNVEAVCGGCGKAIHKGEQALWVRKPGSDKDSMLLHPDCAK